MRLTTRIRLLEALHPVPERHPVFDFDRLDYAELCGLEALLDACGPIWERDSNRLTQEQRTRLETLATAMYDPID